MTQLRLLGEVFFHKDYIKLSNEREGFGDVPLSIKHFKLDVFISRFECSLLLGRLPS